MRSLIAYLLALVAVGAGIWFGFLSRSRTANGESGAPAAATPVILAPVVEAPFADRLSALGTAVANESVRLTTNRSDLVTALYFDDGQHVEANALLLELATDEERGMLDESKALLAEREAEYRRQVELSEQRIASESQVQTALAQLEAARSRVRTLEATIADHAVRAPFAGVLGLRQVSVGTLLQPTTLIATLDDLSVVKVDFTIPETWLSAVRVGQDVTMRSDAWRGRTFPGTISAIDTRLDAATRSARIRALVPNPETLLRPGMLLKVDVDRGEAPSLQVPEESIVQRGGDHFVYVVDKENRAREVAVTVGRRQVGRVEVLGGITAGQEVVVEGIVRVRDGIAVEVVERRSGIGAPGDGRARGGN
jgi:membrane fusion protein, multidrug efflux system